MVNWVRGVSCPQCFSSHVAFDNDIFCCDECGCLFRRVGSRYVVVVSGFLSRS